MLPEGDRFDRANQMFSDALDLPAAERDGFVRQACGADAGLCDSVLKLISRFDRLGDFLEKPASDGPGARVDLAPGDVLDARVRILEFRGRGGMGEVYRAEDLKLGEPVAIKIVRAEWRSDPAMLARLHDEIKLARRVSHPNVCRVHGILTASIRGREIVCLEMEYLDGDSLAATLASRGKLDTASLLRIASGTAAALDAAHREGVIHRDLKPGNIILARDRRGEERPVITDFGLARSDEANSGEHTQSGMIAGSPDYMAPEQFIGEKLTAAVDIFAFGLIVYEMAAGKRPFPSESIVRAAVRRLMESPAPLSRAAPEAPRHWDRVLARALARDPARRYSTAGAMVADLRDRPSVATAAFRGIRAPGLSRRGWLIASGAGVTAMSSFFALSRLHNQALPEAPLIMLTPVKSASPANAAALDLQIEKGLLQSAHVRVLGADKIRAAWKLMGKTVPFPPALEPRDAREIALREGAQFVLFGNLEKVADGWVLPLDLELLSNAPAYPKEKFPGSFTADSEQGLLTAAAKAVEWVRQKTGESADRISAHSRAPEAITTKSWPALQEYTVADNAWRSREMDGRWLEDQRAAAEVHLTRALESDPDFALAAARLADIQVASGEFDEGMGNYQRAARIIDANNLTDRESLRIRGLFALDAGQYDKAQQVFAAYAWAFPDDVLPLFYEASCVEREGNPESALSLIDQAITKSKGSYAFLIWRTLVLLVLRRFADAEAQIREAAKLYGHDMTYQMQAVLAFARFDMPGVWRELEHMKSSGSLPYRSKALLFEACLRAEQNRWEQAELLLHQAIAFDRANGQPSESEFEKQRALAVVHIHQGRPGEAVTACRRILDKTPGQRAILEAGALLARAGDIRGAEQCLPNGLPKSPPVAVPLAASPNTNKALLEWPVYWRRILLLWAEIALFQGDAKKAFALLRNAPAPEKTQEWPSALFRAAILANERATTQRLLGALLANPAAYWLVSDVSGPGFIRDAIARSETLIDSSGNRASLKRFLDQSN